MADTPRDEIADIARLLSAHLGWQRELGAVDLPRTGAFPEVILPPVAPRPEVLEVRPPVVETPPPARDLPPVAVLRAPVAPAPSPPPLAAPVERALSDAADTREPTPWRHGEDHVAALRVIADEVADCTRCKLSTTRRNTVFSRGDPAARLCFIGEGPGEHEDIQGLPFVGPAGQLLDRIIVAMGLSPDAVYIANIVKCRPPNNRVPEHDEMTACTPYLVRQLQLVRPEVIVALGRTAVSFLLATKESMGRLRGRWNSYQGIPVLPTWHPAYLLRNPEAKGDTWADMKLVLEKLGLSPPRRG